MGHYNQPTDLLEEAIPPENKGHPIVSYNGKQISFRSFMNPLEEKKVTAACILSYILRHKNSSLLKLKQLSQSTYSSKEYNL